MTIYDFFNRSSNLLNKIFVKPFVLLSFKKHGKNITIGRKCHFNGIGHISLGNRVTLGYESVFLCTIAHVIIGDDVMFGPRVTIITGDHRTDIIGRTMKSITDKEKLPANDQDIVIEGDNWICANAVI
jgi:acetyltransferase-like isoleucine patch superfamily enzyme